MDSMFAISRDIPLTSDRKLNEQNSTLLPYLGCRSAHFPLW
jgi:hypothetical protein